MHTLPTAPLKRRLAALVYEALLIGAVTAVAALIAGIIATVLNTLSPLLSSLVVSVWMLAAWWFYFKLNWARQGQTLPMRVWQIGLADDQGRRPPLPQLRLRFMWACLFLVLIPALAYLALRSAHIAPQAAAAAALFWWILPWGFALLNPQRQFLYDYLAGTILADQPKESGR